MREPELKAALIDGLYESGMLDEASVIISEMPVNGMSRRADVVLANGHLIAFEIKSDGDKVDRLRGQIDSYQRFFEGVVVLCGSRHAITILDLVPEHVGVFIIDDADQRTMRMLRKPHLKPLSLTAALQHMNVGDLSKMLRKQNMALPLSKDRSSLERMAENLPISVLRSSAIDAVKCRYRKPFEAFVSMRSTQTTLTAISALRRDPWKNVPTADAAELAAPYAGISLPRVHVIPRRLEA